jgi:hypothetical protein
MLTDSISKSDNDKNDLTWTAICFICLSSLEMKTKKMMREMIVMTTTTIPQKRPVLAWLQSTLYCWCLDNRGYCGDKHNNATEETSVGMAAVHTVLLVPRQQRLLW